MTLEKEVMGFPNFHLLYAARWPGGPLQARNQEKMPTFVKSVVEQGSEGAVTPRVNVRRPEEEEEEEEEKEEKEEEGGQPRARLHRRSFKTDPALSSCKARLPFLFPPCILDIIIITHTSIKSNILRVTHIFRSVLRSVRPAAEPA